MDWHNGIDAIAFDKDGTFLDFTQTWGHALNRVIDDLSPDPAKGAEVAAMLGFDRKSVTFDPHSNFVGGSQHSYGPIWAAMIGLPHDGVFNEKLATSFERHVFSAIAMIDGAAEVLIDIKKSGKPIGVATNDTIRATERQLKHLQIDHLFHFVAGYDSGHGPKPGGGMIRAFAASTGVAPSRIAMVGDSINDALAAQDAGTLMIGVRTGPEAHPDFERLCHVVLPSIRELPALMARKAA
jgi:phosphoglycolate phosphatase